MPTVLILGASGKIGQHSATAFWNAGWTVRRYQRGTDMNAAAQGADVILNGMNPPNYHNWAVTIPQITSQVIEAAKASGASVILPGNVYNFGNVPGVWSEETPQNPCAKKGRIRVDLEESYRASGVQTIVLRAGSFIDPDHNGCAMDLIYLREIRRGKITVPGGADIRHAFCYLPDWARAAVMLANKRDELATFEDIPFEGHSFSASALKAELQKALGRELKLARFPWWIMTLASPFWELARELKEMRYLWETDHALCGEKLTRLLPDFQPTDLAVVMRAGLPVNIHPDQTVRARRKAIPAE